MRRTAKEDDGLKSQAGRRGGKRGLATALAVAILDAGPATNLSLAVQLLE